ncbi:MAG: hypothetical protein IT213_05780 [Cytophagales bacterium]|jgi:hypothetical protein|nr:hypothetical protein [Cytophagales bacterium]
MALQGNTKQVSDTQNIHRQNVGEDSNIIDLAIKKNIESKSILEVVRGKHTEYAHTLEDQLYEAKACCKIKTSSIAMYLPDDRRSRFFRQLDNLMDIENWEEDDKPVTEASFTTLLRLLLFIRPKRNPSLGATSDGNILAAWVINNQDRLTIECLAGDKVRWVLCGYFEENFERVAGEATFIARLPEVLSPYNPGHWFTDET